MSGRDKETRCEVDYCIFEIINYTIHTVQRVKHAKISEFD